MSHPIEPTPDRLSGLLERFRVRAHLFHTGA
ncbi:MAG TPA: AraC family transcriptional regulator, partial [Cupriavidus sp.]|nr:AraC family transcriptional regulator [Cupriavidus sp.]